MAGGDSPWRGVRYTNLSNTWGPGGALVPQPGRLLELRLVSYTAASAICQLYDHTRFPQNPLGPLNAAGGQPDQFPHQPIQIPVLRGLYVSFSMGTGRMDVGAAWIRP